jgi:hypothetical protein
MAAVLGAAACAATPEVASSTAPSPTSTAQSPAAAAAPAPRIETVPRTAEAPQPALAAGFEPIFAAEFADREAARAAWRDHGGFLLERVEPSLYPRVPAETFNARALDRVRAMRAARPNASLEDLSYAALDGLYSRAWLSESFVTSVDVSRVGAVGRDAIPLTDQEFATLVSSPPRPELDRSALAGTDVLALRSLQRGDVELVERLLAARSGPLVLDLRGAGGFRFDEIARLVSLFAPRDGLLFTVVSADQELNAYAASADQAADDGPVLAVISVGTGPDALMLAVALADAGRGRIAGTLAEPVRGVLTASAPWGECRSVVYRCDASSVRYPGLVLVRAGGAPLADGFAVDYPVDAWDAAALEPVVARWRSEVDPGQD